MTRREALGGLLALPWAGKRGVSRAGDFAAVRKLIEDAVAEGKATGVAVAVVYGGAVVWEEGFGWANREAGVKATSGTPFSLASLTKPFTTTTMATLAAEGRLSLDDVANRYLAQGALQSGGGDAGKVSIRLLGAHASGLPTLYEQFERGEAALALSPDALLRNYGRLAYPPGTTYEYSNVGFAALDAIGRNVTGKEMGTLITQRVLEPLGLRDSFFDTDRARLPEGAVRYSPAGTAIPYYTTATPASGELYASARDLARFAMAQMKNSVEGATAVFPQERWVDELQVPVLTGPSGVATTFGWFVSGHKSKLPVLFKSGGQPGVANLMYLVPSENLACVVLTNRSDGRALCRRICGEILGRYLPGWHQPEETSGPSATPLVITSEWEGLWQGTLANDGAQMRVALELRRPASVSLALDDQPAKAVHELKSEGASLTGVCDGVIASPDALRWGARTLKLKLLLQGGRIAGRVLATAGDPNWRNVMLPFVLRLQRTSGVEKQSGGFPGD